MKNLFRTLPFLLMVAFSACSDGSSGSAEATVDEPSIAVPEGMVFVAANKKNVVLGTDDGLAKSNERPGMRVEFSYDFCMDRHEVTCGEFAKLTDGQWGGFADCGVAADINLPMVNVTYYDAVLYANAKSKARDMDSCYQYSAVDLDSAGHCVGLENLTLLTDVDGFRLPTEAEWMLVAANHWKPEESWDSKNSDYELHPVCSRQTEATSFCDIAGNVKEWVNDWLGYFKDSTVVNYAGAPDGGRLGERVVKGGSFRNDFENIDAYNRGDVYSVTSLTKGDYLGFRLAYGKIPDALWMDNNGLASTSVIQVTTSIKKMYGAVGSYQSKLVFRNDESGNLAFVDFASGSTSVVEIADTVDSYHPDVSPDGSKVAFCTGLEGVAQKSKLYVRNLDSAGTGLVQLDVESAAIPRWRVSAGDTSIIYVSDAGENNEDGDFLKKSTWQVPFSNGKFGTPQKLFDGAYHGGVSEDGRLAVSGARLLRARVVEKGHEKKSQDTVWYGSEQACNASLSNDGSKRTLFLDFSGKTGRDFVKKKYGVHEQLLIVDESGKLIQNVAAPTGYSFDHSEWVLNAKENSVAANLAVVSLTGANGSHSKIALVNLADSSVVALVSGNELWHPCLWVKPSASVKIESALNLDSAGVYLSEKHDEMASIYRYKMELYWTNLPKTDVLIIGSSRAELGVAPDELSSWNALNISGVGIDPDRDIYLIRSYAMNHEEKLKAIVVSLDLDNWRDHDKALASLLNSAPGYIYDMNHNYWAGGVPKDFAKIVKNSYPPEKAISEMYSDAGGRYSRSRSWDADGIEKQGDSVFTEYETVFLEDRMQAMVDISDSLAKKGIYLIGVIFPQAPQYKDLGRLGRYGLQRSVAEKEIAWLDSMANARKYFILMDENKMGRHDYKDSHAYNMDHLSYEGAKKLTARIDSVLKTLKW